MKRIIICIFVFLLIVFTANGCSLINQNSIQPGGPTVPIKTMAQFHNWLMWGYDSLHTGASEDILKLPQTMAPLWTFFENDYYADHCSPLIFKDSVYILMHGSPDKLVCLKKSDGSKSWEFHLLSNNILSYWITPAIADFGNKQYIFFNSHQIIYALDLVTQNVIWQKQLTSFVTSPFTIWEGIISPDTVPTKYLFVSANRIYCFNAFTGGQRWVTETIIKSTSPTISNDIDNNQVFVGSENRLLRLDINNGSITGSFHAEGPIDSAPAINGLNIFFGSGHSNNDQKGHFYCVSRSSMNQIWKYDVDNFNTSIFYGSFNSSPCVLASKNYVYVGCSDGMFYCFNCYQRTNVPVQPIWKILIHRATAYHPDMPKPKFFSVISGKNGNPRIIVSGYDLLPLVLNPLNGSITWRIVGINGYTTPPSISGSSIYIADRPGRVFRYGSE